MSTIVYFVRPVGAIGPIKIGCTADLPKRVEGLAAWSPVPLEVLCTIPGGRETERRLHDHFVADFSHHEWFRASPELLNLIEGLCKGEPLSALLPEAVNPGVFHRTTRRREGAWQRKDADDNVVAQLIRDLPRCA